MRQAKRSRAPVTLRLWVGLSVAVALVSAAAIFSGTFNTAPESAAREDPAQTAARLTAAAAARIRAESRNPRPAPAIVAAPRPLALSRGPEPGGEPPTPPDGYEFSVHHGEMARAPLDGAYPRRPDEDETAPPWMDYPDSVNALVRQAGRAGRDWSFGWIRLAPGAGTDELRAGLRRLGGEVLGDSGRLVRARLPGDAARLEALLALKAVDAVGAVPAKLKQPAPLAPPGQAQVPVFVTLMADDPDGRWRRALEGLGAVVGWFDADIRAYTATIPPGAAGALAEADFVLAVEPVGIVEAAHDSAVPAMGADALRTWRSPGIFRGGGASVPIGVMDTGLNVNHPDISSNRNSICGANFVAAERRLEDLDLWVDRDGHGTHSTGTFAGNGFTDPLFAGMAPSVRDIRFAKALDRTGGGGSDSIVRAMDFFAMPTACAYAGPAGPRLRPLIVNASLGLSGRAFTGRGADQRKLDAMVWRHRQLYVVAQGNESDLGFGNVSGAKNSLAVGAVYDSGPLAPFSSHGPTGDGRLAPQVVATGVGIKSPRGGGSRSGYRSASGTSSASPAVAGVAALLMDAAPAFRNQPALARARLMSSAVKPDPWFDADGRFPANNTAGPGDLQSQYGLGRVSARTSVLSRSGADGWTNGSATSEPRGGEYAFRDISVPKDASRLDVVLTWDEPPADTISNSVLNDLDLWLDRGGDCGPADCGEYSSVSRKDNVEWIVVRNPPPGTYRAKILPRQLYAGAPRAALAWTVIRGGSTPTLRIGADSEELPAGRHRLTLTLSSDAYVAAGVRLRADCRSDAGKCEDVKLESAKPGREDGVDVSGSDWPRGTHLELGEIGAGEAQEVELFVNYRGSGAVRLYFTATSWNANAAVRTVKAGDADTGVPAIPAPANDHFAGALAIGGAKGSVDLDLASATTEPGEPPIGTDAPQSSGDSQTVGPPAGRPPAPGRPAASAWYAWTAPADGEFRFALGRRSPVAEAVYLAAYRGDDIAGLERMETKNGSFFAEKGASYRVRVSSPARRAVDSGPSGPGPSEPLTLGWSPTERPANDDFGFATAIDGAEGSTEGNNQGATLESGEWLGPLAASVWHSWTAPEDGAVRFSTSSGLVMAFTGDTVSALRLVSHFPDDRAEFPVRAGAEYHIAVTAVSAFLSGAPYELSWEYNKQERDGNDDFAGAEQLDGAVSSSHQVGVDRESSVQPGEPAGTGVRTRWWSWTAPESGAYTWRLDDPTHAELLISAFTGESLSSLELAGSTGPEATSFEFSFDAVQNRRYRISVGLPIDDYSTFRTGELFTSLVWGRTPPNDGSANAARLSGAAGSTPGSNAFATVEPGERIHGLGHSSLWWTWEAPAAGWRRFYLENPGLPFALAVYEVAADGSLKLIGVSRSTGGAGGGGPASALPGQGPPAAPPIEVVFRAEPGKQYRIRLGAMSAGPGGDFTLQWEETDAPVWLEYLGQLSGGDTDPAGAYIEPDLLAGLSGLAFGGGKLYAAASGGLRAFERDSDTGALTLAQSLAKDWSGSSPSLLHDPRRNRLHAHECFQWDTFSTAGARVSDRGEDAHGAGLCGNGAAFMDSGQSSVYLVEEGNGLAVLGFDSRGRLRHDESISVRGMTDALISTGDSHVYAVTDQNGSVVVFERDSDDGELSEIGSRPPPGGFPDAIHRGLAISPDGAYLFVVKDSAFGNEVVAFGIGDDPAKPERLHSLPLDTYLGFRAESGCRFGAPRRQAAGLGVFCDGMIFGLKWDSGSRRLSVTDVIEGADRFDNAVPHFETPLSLTLSPDGKHAYLATEDAGILYFERVGNLD